MKIELDERALRRANPSRTTKLAAVSGGDAFRDALAALGVAPPAKDVDAAAKLLAILDPFEENHEALIEPVVAGVGRALGSTGLLRALMASNHTDGRATLTHYDYMQRDVWLAAARFICAAPDADYAAVRDEAAKARAERPKDKGFRAALAMIFPSEPWATEDAKAFRGEPRGGDGDRATCLLLACDDWATCERLMKAMLANGSMTPSAPAYALLHRFGERAEPLVIAAYERSLEARDAVASAWIAGALACVASPAVEALFQKRIGKKVGGAEADAYFRRWPELAKGATKKKAPAKKNGATFAVIASFDMYAHEGDATTKRWRACKTSPKRFDDWPKRLARPKKPTLVGDALDRFRERLEIGDTSVRGVVPQKDFEADGVELLSLFRLGEEAPIYFDGDIVAFSFELGWGVRLALFERGESELTVVDEVPDMEAELRKLVE